MPEPITRFTALEGGTFVSPDGHWVLAAVGHSGLEGARILTVSAYPVEGGDAVPLCDDCVVHWGLGGKFLYVTFQTSPSDSGVTVAIPIPGGEALPALPDDGLQSEEDALALPDVRIIEQGFIAPGPDPSIYAFLRRTVQRNLYRIPLPR